MDAARSDTIRALMPHQTRPHRARAVAAIFAGATIFAAAGCGGQNVKTDRDDLVRGKQLFVAKCGSCHVLARAGTKGNVGPDLDAAFSRSLQDGFGRSAIRGVVEYQITYPAIGKAMPAKLVKGDDVGHVAAYVATVAAKGGKDEGLVGSAVKAPGAGKPAVAVAGKLEIDADPTGQLAFVTNKAGAKPGSVTFTMANKSSTPHNIALKQGSTVLGQGKVVGGGGTSTFRATLKPGSYEFFCEVQGHEQGGMKGTLTVR